MNIGAVYLATRSRCAANCALPPCTSQESHGTLSLLMCAIEEELEAQRRCQADALLHVVDKEYTASTRYICTVAYTSEGGTLVVPRAYRDRAYNSELEWRGVRITNSERIVNHFNIVIDVSTRYSCRVLLEQAYREMCDQLFDGHCFVLERTAAHTLMAALVRKHKYCEHVCIAAHVLAAITHEPWLMTKPFTSDQLCYFGNFGTQPATVSEIQAIADYAPRLYAQQMPWTAHDSDSDSE